jgi:nicotinamide-nucleotide amidase
LNIEIINTGTELMLGLVLNTHHQWLCQRLGAEGYEVSRQLAIPDTADAILEAVRESLARADFIIVTGGLGPTSDDRTRDMIAQLLGRKLILNEAIYGKLKAFFAERNRPMSENNLAQAQVPEGAMVLDNPNGTAPGLAIEVPNNHFRADGKKSWIVMLPGPPRELHPMFVDRVLPLLRREFPLDGQFVSRTLRTTGLGESAVEDKIAPALHQFEKGGLVLGYCAHMGEVEVRLTARGDAASKLIADAESVVREKLGSHVYGIERESLAAVVVRLLTERKQFIATAESCTGGYVANAITNISGASAVFSSGWVTYSNEAKQRFLGVSADTLAKHGAVSEPTVREMAEGARATVASDYALAITGIAGPTGGTLDKPVGTVFIALATGRHTFVLNPVNRYDRETFKQVTCRQALDLLRRTLLKR